MGNRCGKCGAEFFPPVYICKRCGAHKLQDKEMPRTGKIITHTQLYDPLPGFETQVPLNIAIVELTNGARVLGQIVDSPQERVRTGAKAKAVVRRVKVDGESGQILYGYKFVVE